MQAQPESETPPPIFVYGTAWCGDCMRAKRILQQFRVPFAWIDIEEDEQAAEFVETTSHGMQSVPVIVFGDGSLLVEPSNGQLVGKLRALQLA